jgi:uncharacterized Zn-binding protein involved in type VI secretion
MKPVCVDGMTLETDPSTVSCSMSMVGPPSSKVKAEGKGAWHDGDKVSVSNVTVPSAGATIPDPGPYQAAFAAGAAKVKADGKLVLLEGDETATISATPKIPGSPPTNYPVSFKVKASAAGQSKALGS